MRATPRRLAGIAVGRGVALLGVGWASERWEVTRSSADMSIYTGSIKFLRDHAPSDEHLIIHLAELKAACDNEILLIGMKLVESGKWPPRKSGESQEQQEQRTKGTPIT
jgi:hypothetical protein